MIQKQSYTFTLLRYVHDVASGEFVNVGLVLYSPKNGYLKAIVKKSYGRVTALFPEADGEGIKRTIGAIAASINSYARTLANQTQLSLDGNPESALEFALRALPADDSSLQWTSNQGGLTSAPAETAQRLFERLIRRYDRKAKHERRSDDQIWKEFSRVLEDRHLEDQICEHDVASSVETVHFKRALKNGKWHLLEPVSFDLVDGDWIKNKAKQILGQMMGLKEAKNDDFKLYLLLGQPKHAAVEKDFQTAVRYLQKIPVACEIYTEAETERFGAEIARVMAYSG